MASVGSLAMTLLVMTLAAHVAPSDLITPGVRSMPRRDIPIFFPDTSQFDPVRPRPHGHVAPVFQPQPLPIPGDEDLDLLPVDIDELAQSDLQRLNSFTNISEFISFFNLNQPAEEELSISGGLTTRVGGVAEKKELAEMANCKPELVTVPLELPEEGNTIYFPTCVRLEQCGGCCFGPRLICRPTVSKVVTFKVLKTVTGADTNTSGGSRRGAVTGGSERRRRRRRRRRSTASYHEVEALKHTACTCGCRVQESDCNNRIHNYFEGECACVCKNRDEKRKCEEQNSTRYWDDTSCSCYCRKTQDCSTGQFFSQQTCRCEFSPGRSGLTLRSPPVEGTTA